MSVDDKYETGTTLPRVKPCPSSRSSEDAPTLADAIATAEACCERFVIWYDHGVSAEAGNVAYDTVSCLRALLASAKALERDTERLERELAEERAAREFDAKEITYLREALAAERAAMAEYVPSAIQNIDALVESMRCNEKSENGATKHNCGYNAGLRALARALQNAAPQASPSVAPADSEVRSAAGPAVAAPSSAIPNGWIATGPSGRTLHFAQADGWDVQQVTASAKGPA